MTKREKYLLFGMVSLLVFHALPEPQAPWQLATGYVWAGVTVCYFLMSIFARKERG